MSLIIGDKSVVLFHYTLTVDGESNPDAVWYYAEPKEAAREIKGRVAFWKGVKVVAD